MQQAVFPEGVNTIGAVAILAFFVCVIAGAIAFIPFYRLLRGADPERPFNVWRDLEVRKASFASSSSGLLR